MGTATEDLQKAATLPDGDVVRKLLEQHARIRTLFDEVRNTEGDSRQEAFDELRGLLVVHETAEETIVRPVIRKLLGDEEPDARNAEEAEATKDLEELMKMDVADGEFLVKLDSLEQAVDEHAETEEQNEFAALQRECTPDERAAMGRKVDAAAKIAPTRPHPSVAGHEKAAMAVGPIAGLIDRTRDAIAKAAS